MNPYVHPPCLRFLAVCFLAALLLGFGLTGCEQKQPAQELPETFTSPTKLRIGLLPEQDIFAQKKRYEPLLHFLSKQTGTQVEVCILPRYGNIIDNFNELALDGAFFGSFTGAMAIQKLGVIPLARPQYVNGSSTYYGMVFVKKGSGIRTVEDMRDKRMVFVDKATTAGYLLPLAFFKSLGIDDYTHWFNETYFSGTHEGAINDVLGGVADVGAAKNTVFYRMAAGDRRVTRDLEILATSPHVPANGLAVRQDLPKELQNKLQKLLLNMNNHKEGRNILYEMNIEKFIVTSRTDYQPVLDYAAEIGLDLKTYQYLNN